MAPKHKESTVEPGPSGPGGSATGRGGLSLRAILDMPAVRRAVPEVVVGGDQLHRLVRWVHAGEVSYIASMLKGGELLLTTGLGLGRLANGQRRFIAELSERGVVAVAIELGTRFKSPPRPLIDEARKRGVVLIAFHHEIPFIEITEAVHSEIISHQLSGLRRSEEVHQRFFKLVLEGAGTPEILAALAAMTGGPVFLERSGHGLLYHESAGRDEAETLAGWESFRRGLTDSTSTVAHDVPLGGETRWGRLVAFTPDRKAGEFDRVAVERAVEVVALALLRDREEEAVRSRERGNFLAGLVRGDFREEVARARATAMGMSRRERLVPVVAGRSPDLAAGPGQTASWMRIWTDVQAAADDLRLTMVAGTREHERQLIAVVGLTRDADRERTLDLLAELIGDACERRLDNRAAVLVCGGAENDNWVAVGRSLNALVESMPAAAVMPPRPWHDFAGPSLDRLLWGLRDNEELDGFVSARLGPLADPGDRNSARLLETLSVYCRHAGRKAETARALNIERQSLYHRLRRIEQILGVDLADGDTLTELHLALRARRAAGWPSRAPDAAAPGPGSAAGGARSPAS